MAVRARIVSPRRSHFGNAQEGNVRSDSGVIWASSSGATVVEYAIMAAGIAAVIVAVVLVLGQGTCDTYQLTSGRIADELGTEGGPGSCI